MNLATALEPRLWDVVRSNIEDRKFTPAILDAIHFLTDVIRERSGLEGDGVALVGAAFGGDSPKLKVNRLQTDTEKSTQKGVEAMLRGLYQAIRNPRSHESFQDDERDATALLLFIDHLLRVVDKSGSPFSVGTFVGRVLEKDFVSMERYAKLLVAEIPAKKRLAVCREVFARRDEADIEKVKHFFTAILAEMPADAVAELCDLLSQELTTTNDEGTIRFTLGALLTLWPKITEIARLRIENKLIGSVEEGNWSKSQRQCHGGALATWAGPILNELTLKDEFWDAVFDLLGSSDETAQDYALHWFLPRVESAFDAPPTMLAWRVNNGLEAGNPRFKTLAERWRLDDVWNPKKKREPDHSWVKPFAEALANFKEKQATLDQEIPF